MRRLTGIGLLALCLGAPAVAEYEPARGDFEFNRALFHHYAQNHLSAVLATQRLSGEADDDRRRLIAENLLSYGLYREALGHFRPLLRDGDLTPNERADIWMRIARYEFERGYFDAAEATLTEMRVDVGARRSRTERSILQAQIQMRRGQHEAAIESLLDGRSYTKDDFARFNLGMAYIAAGEVRRGRRELDVLGRQVVTDPTEHALRDRANLALGYNYLAEAKGGSARPVLRRIRRRGPFSEEALLGLGWAEIAPEVAEDIRFTPEDNADTISGALGVILRPGQVDSALRARLGMLDASDAAADSSENRFRRALVPWLELDGRDPKKPAVLEVQLAIPYALDALGETERAREFYARAVERLEQGREGLDLAMDGIRSGRMIDTMIRREPEREAGWNWRLRDLPDAPETYYLAEILADHQFQEALKNYRDLRQLQRQLARDRDRLDIRRGGHQLASVPASELFDRALRAREEPLWGELSVPLKLETRLHRFPRNETLEGLLAWTYRYAPKVPLTLARQAPDFGPIEAPPVLADLQVELDAALDAVNSLLPQQRRLLESIATDELEQQKAQLTRYLIDARFALARMYDDPDTGVEQP